MSNIGTSIRNSFKHDLHRWHLPFNALIQHEIRTSVFTHTVKNETVYEVRSKYTTIGAGPHVSIFHVARSNAELWPLLCTEVCQNCVHNGASSAFDGKWSSLCPKTLRVSLRPMFCMADKYCACAKLHCLP